MISHLPLTLYLRHHTMTSTAFSAVDARLSTSNLNTCILTNQTAEYKTVPLESSFNCLKPQRISQSK